MKKARKLISPILLCMALDFANMAGIGFPVMTAHAEEPVYTVTLSPGDGIGDPITYRSDEKPIAEDWRSAKACDFYYENGEIGFCLPVKYCPDSFRAKDNYAFNGWEDNVGYNNLTSAETTFVAKWLTLDRPDMKLSPEVFTVTSDSFDTDGFSPVSVEITELIFGQGAVSRANMLLIFDKTELNLLSDEEGSLVCAPYSVDHSEGGERLGTGSLYKAGVYEFALYIDPIALAAATPGTYEGRMEYDIYWRGTTGTPRQNYGYIAISLTVTGDDSALPPSDEPEGVLIHRMYNPNSGEHFYTESDEERDVLIAAGWIDEEECCFMAPEAADDTLPVYRLYNPNGNEHFFTIDKEEAENLEEYGWISEGIRFHAYDTDSEQGVHLYRAYNPNDGHHFFTTDKAEQDYVVSLGFRDEGIGWNVMS